MKVKKLFALMLALLMVVSLAACSSSSSKSSSSGEMPGLGKGGSTNTDVVEANTDYTTSDLSNVTIGYVTINSAAPWGGRVGTKLEEYAKEVGATVNSLDANTDADLVTQYCQQFIDEGVDVLCVFGGDVLAMVDVCKSAEEAGIPVFLCALDLDTSGQSYATAMIGPDQYDAFVEIAKYVVEQNGEDYACNVYEINGVPFLQDYIDRTSGFEDTIAAYSSYNLAGIEDCYSDRTAAKTATENWLTAGMSAGDIIIGYDDDLTMGAVQALEEAGMTGQVKIYSYTGQQDAIQAVLDGQIEMTVLNRADSIGAATVSAINEWLTTGDTARYQQTELVYITAENAQTYLDMYAEAGETVF